MFDRLFYAIFGDFMEQDALDLAVERLAEAVGDVERDSLALAIRVGGEVDMVLALGLLLYFIDDFRLARDDVVFGLEVMLDIDAEGAFGQIDDMADRGGNLVVGPQVSLDGFRLGRRFYYDEVLCHYFFDAPGYAA